MSTEHAQLVFLALADPTRRLIIQRLLDEEVATITRLTVGLPITRQAVTKHLNTLVEAGLLTSRVEGRQRLYQLHPEPLQEVTDWVAQIEARWDTRLEALHRYLMQQETTIPSNEEPESSS